MNLVKWLDMKFKLVYVIKGKFCDEWCEIMEGIDVCFVLVLLLGEVLLYLYNIVWGIFVEFDG